MQRYKTILGITIDDIWYDKENYLNSEKRIVCLHTTEQIDNKLWDVVLKGYTIVIDIENEVEEIFKRFDYKSCRYPINKIRKANVDIHIVDFEEERKKYLDYQNSFLKDRRLPTIEYNELNDLSIYVAYNNKGVLIGGCAFIESADKKTVRYKYGATEHIMGLNELILFLAMRDYHDKGYKVFDMGGVGRSHIDDNSKEYKIYKFKKKFGGELVEDYRYFKGTGFSKALLRVFWIIVIVFFAGDDHKLIELLGKKRLIR